MSNISSDFVLKSYWIPIMKLFKPQINYLRIENDKTLIWIGKSMSYGAKSLNTTIFDPSL